MQINWLLRFRNKPVLTALIAGIVEIVYLVLDMAGIVPSVTSSQILELCGLLISVLVIAGIVIDPTTDGVGDSDLAMTYEYPRNSDTDPISVIDDNEDRYEVMDAIAEGEYKIQNPDISLTIKNETSNTENNQDENTDNEQR